MGRACFWCCEPVKRKWSLFCSRKCKGWHRSGEAAIERVVDGHHRSTCKCCGERFTCRKRANSKRTNEYCSVACRNKSARPTRQRHPTLYGLYVWACGDCSVTTLRRSRHVRVRCASCRRVYEERARIERMASRYAPVERRCKGCGSEWVSSYGDTRKVYCSRRCSHRHLARQVGASHRKRARHYGVAYEYINRSKVIRRDGWRCGICGEKISKAARYPDPQSPSLDHIVPLSKGGGHLYDNVQASHWSCNVAKGADTAGSQLLIFGGRCA
jgi:hypothetical protein